MLNKLTNLAVYLDEVGDDPFKAIAHCGAFPFKQVVLRTLWGDNITALSDRACQQLREHLRSAQLKVLLVAAEINDRQQLERSILLTRYFDARYLRVNLNAPFGPWITQVSDFCLASNLVPLAELSLETVRDHLPSLLQLLNLSRRWKLIYDPVQFIAKCNLDPFKKYWPLLKAHTLMVDLHDYKIGYGHRPVGEGDGRLRLTIDDLLTSGFTGWFLLEPGLGPKFATKLEAIRVALAALERLGDDPVKPEGGSPLVPYRIRKNYDQSK